MDRGADDPLAMAITQWQFVFIFIFSLDLPRWLGALLTPGSVTKLPLGSS